MGTENVHLYTWMYIQPAYTCCTCMYMYTQLYILYMYMYAVTKGNVSNTLYQEIEFFTDRSPPPDYSPGSG